MIINWYTGYRTATGEIVSCFTAAAEAVAANLPADCSALEGQHAPSAGYVVGGAFVAFPPKPHASARFDFATQEWVDDLAKARALQWAKIKAARETAEFGGFTWDGSRFDSDLTSQSRIQGAVQLAGLDPVNFSLDWTLADNSVRALNAQDMTAVGAALGAHVAAQHALGRTLRSQIEAASSPAAIDAIAWPR